MCTSLCVNETALIKIRTASEHSYVRLSWHYCMSSDLHIKRWTQAKKVRIPQTAQNTMHTNIYTQISGIFVGSRRRQCSLLCASHNPLCSRVGDVSDASWFSALVWLSLLTLSNNNDNLCCSLLILGMCDLIVWLGHGKVSVGAH